MATDIIHLRSSLGCAAFLFAGGILVTVCTREVFLTPNCFPRRKLPAAPGTLRVTFPDLAPGTYAVQVIHDAKRIGGLVRDALGIPIGGYALSNEAVGVYGPPPFKDAAVEVGPAGRAVEIRMRYSDPG